MVLFTMISVNAWGFGHSTHYGKVAVTSNGNGSVYVSTSQTAPDPNSVLWKESNELVLNCNGSSSNDSKTYYLHAKPNNGYRFVKWEGEGKNNYTSASQKHTQTLKGTEEVPNTDNFTANFELIPTYISTAIAVPSVNGKVYVSKSNATPTEYSAEQMQDSIHTVVYGQVPKHTYYYYAQSNNDDEYEFVGWSTSEDGKIESSDNPYTKEITSNTGDGTTVTLYTIFMQKVEYYTKLNAIGGIGGSVEISGSNITTEEIDNGMSASSETKQVNAPTISYTLTATAASGYQFSGWYSDAALSNRVSQNASYTVNIEGKTDVEEATKTYYAKFEQLHDYYKHVYAKAVGEGLVYLGTSNRNISDDAYTTVYDIPNHVNQVNAPANSTYYWIAKEVDGYNFKGWYNNEACEGTPVSTNTTYPQSISASKDEDVVTALYAKFAPYDTYYSYVKVVAQEGGVVFVGDGNTVPSLNEYGLEKNLPQSSASKSAPTHSYTLYAQANPGYNFVGWRLNTNTNNASTNSTYQFSFSANSTNEAEPTSRTYTAVFVKKGIWNWEKPTLAAGNYYIYNPAADKFLGNANNGVDAEDATLWTLTDNSGTWKISEGENHVYVDRTGGSVPITQFYQIDPSRFTAYSSGSKTTSDICSDVFWIKGDREYTFNTYLTYYEGLTNNDNDRKGDIYIGLNGANLSTSTENNAQKWYFVTEAEMEAYKEYVAAYNRAVEIVTEIPEWGETKNTLNGIINANVPSQLSTSDANIAALNSIIKVTLSVKAGKYSTIITPFEIELPEGITAYTSSSVNPSTLSVNIDELVSGNEMLPADRPVILKNTTGSDIAKTYYGTSTKEEPVTEGVLIGYYTKGKIVPNGYYSLQTKSGVQQFYPIRQDDYHSAANKCYLIVPDGEELANVRIALDSEETSIDTIANLMNDSEYYSANGVKLSTPKKGVNIVKMSDGSIKKVFVK